MIKNDPPQSAPAPAPQPAPAPAAAAAPAPAEPTLHDFCLDLLTNSAAMKAFEADPTGLLAKAGLNGITPEDVRDVLPLVTDLVPTNASGINLPEGGDSFGGSYKLPFGEVQGAGYYEYGHDGFKGGVEGSVSSSGVEAWGSGHVEAGKHGAHAGGEGGVSTVAGEADGSACLEVDKHGVKADAEGSVSVASGVSAGAASAVDVSKHGIHAGAEGGAITPFGSVAGTGSVDVGKDGIHVGAGGGADTPVGEFAAASAVSLDEDGLAINGGLHSPFGGLESGFYLGPQHETGGKAYGGIDLDGPLDKTVSLTTFKGIGLNQDLAPNLSGNIANLPGKVVSDPTSVGHAIVGAAPALPAVPGLPQIPLSDVKLPDVTNDLPLDLPGGIPGVPAVPALPTETVTHTVSSVQETVSSVHETITSTTGGHLPAVDVPAVPHAPQLPKLELPKLELPKLELPKIDLPKADLPHVDLPKLPGADGAQNGIGGLLDHNPVSDAVHNVADDLHLGL
ncbi:IniB N-terminal domain-containing protein [Kibdelosporangium phytohabitans]|uniref:Uncharacterized protein n=1 Tax=Kibdelosporangium phytohabitans TaxID=860235 RepID=A0A0N9HM86_9PSEU|nr:IniB N-terminal domain-containing protein [Kibdelosporangium phytohabitans]ALG07742.1 hypothetical protein AOZ06_13240 [Kibdelosporangium phytohabitans]MBE1471348.1 hypothetical protein [Kibdelosporangium phytohabitans]